MYTSFQTNEYIIPVTNVSIDSRNYFLNYKIYNELLNFLSLQSKKYSRNFSKSTHRTRSTISNYVVIENEEFVFNNFDLDNASLISTCSDDLLNESFEETQSLNENSCIHDDIEGNLESNEEQSNSKLDSYIEETIELIVRDFVVVWLQDFIWEKDKLAIMAK